MMHLYFFYLILFVSYSANLQELIPSLFQSNLLYFVLQEKSFAKERMLKSEKKIPIQI